MRYNTYPMNVTQFIKTFYVKEIAKNEQLFSQKAASACQHLAEIGAAYVLASESAVQRPLKYDGRFVYAVDRPPNG
jgi:hypothetical protein